MTMQYAGELPCTDPLFGYLKYQIQPFLGDNTRTAYRVWKLNNASNEVYLYEDVSTGSRVIGKFFFNRKNPEWNTARRRLEREKHTLEYMRQFGFDGRGVHYIARVLGENIDLNCLLVEEFCYGELFSKILLRAIANRDDGLLFGKLTALACFFAEFHNRTAESGWKVDFAWICGYYESLIHKLSSQWLLSPSETEEFRTLREHWQNRPFMYDDCQVMVHGDATPENFLCGDGLHVISFDLERLRHSDRLFDIGRMVGEIAHFFLMKTGDRGYAEPFIGHFLWEYACHFPNRERAFASITRRLPFYMGMTFLRIARNEYLSWDYRKKLIYEAKQILWSLTKS